MKRKYLFTLLFTFIKAGTLLAQVALTSLHENFDDCPFAAPGPTGWLHFNPVPGTYPEGAWACGTAYGRAGTPGISCTGYYGVPATTYLDTAILISPALDLSGYPDSIYLNFDTKTTTIRLGARLDLLISRDTTFADTSTHVVALKNVFDQADSSDWVTHQANLTQYRYTSNFYVGFRFISAVSTATASRWFLDNIRTTNISLALAVNDNKAGAAPCTFSVLGSPSAAQVTIAYSAAIAGNYDLTIYDMVGRAVHTQQLSCREQSSSYTISGLQLQPGMYIIKLGNRAGYSVARAVVQ